MLHFQNKVILSHNRCLFMRRSPFWVHPPCIQAYFNASHSPFLCFQGLTSGHVKLIVDRLLRRVNRTVINLSLDSPFIVRHWHATKWSVVERFSRAKSAYLPAKTGVILTSQQRSAHTHTHTHLLNLITTTVWTTELDLFISLPRPLAMSFLRGVGSTCKVIDYFFSSFGHRATTWHA